MRVVRLLLLGFKISAQGQHLPSPSPSVQAVSSAPQVEEKSSSSSKEVPLANVAGKTLKTQ